MENPMRLREVHFMAKRPKRPPRKRLGPSKKHFIKEWRRYRDMGQAEVATLLSVSTSHISQIERGTMNYTRATLEDLAYALKCEPADLLGRNPSTPESALWRFIVGLNPEQQAQALRVLEVVLIRAA